MIPEILLSTITLMVPTLQEKIDHYQRLQREVLFADLAPFPMTFTPMGYEKAGPPIKYGDKYYSIYWNGINSGELIDVTSHFLPHTEYNAKLIVEIKNATYYIWRKIKEFFSNFGKESLWDFLSGKSSLPEKPPNGEYKDLPDVLKTNVDVEMEKIKPVPVLKGWSGSSISAMLMFNTFFAEKEPYEPLIIKVSKIIYVIWKKNVVEVKKIEPGGDTLFDKFWGIKVPPKPPSGNGDDWHPDRSPSPTPSPEYWKN